MGRLKNLQLEKKKPQPDLPLVTSYFSSTLEPFSKLTSFFFFRLSTGHAKA